ncbi:hypothetical protein ABT121_31170 [Streptomyces sp. NPDC001928]|uniref:hypothetical protein n=1 Tax=Streptomyces sp. NPDC001928 TaxID=3154404 RepID=UPI00331BAB6A
MIVGQRPMNNGHTRPVPGGGRALLMFEDVQNATVTSNTFAAAPDHAIGLAIGSTGAHVAGNEVGARIRYEVGIDESSRPGYEGPEPGGAP